MMEQLYPTTHNSAAPADFAKTVLMPGDPLRAQKIAKEYLTDAKLVNNVRGVQGYTGTFHGKRVSVMASGMGMPSMGIYSYELFRIYGVENIIRIGSAGALREDIHVRDLVLGMGASTDSAYASNFGLPGTFAPICSYRLLSGSVRLAEQAGFRYHVGNLLSSDVFYSDDPTANARWAKMGILAVEMEAAALYMNAARYGKRAVCICTISDHIRTGELTTSEERQNSFTTMMKVALDVAVAMEKK